MSEGCGRDVEGRKGGRGLRKEGGRDVVSDDLQVSLTEHFGVSFCRVRDP